MKLLAVLRAIVCEEKLQNSLVPQIALAKAVVIQRVDLRVG